MTDIIESCDGCPHNKGVHGEEIICFFDYDPFDCPLKREG